VGPLELSVCPRRRHGYLLPYVADDREPLVFPFHRRERRPVLHHGRFVVRDGAWVPRVRAARLGASMRRHLCERRSEGPIRRLDRGGVNGSR
jgi:hypothetical protein